MGATYHVATDGSGDCITMAEVNALSLSDGDSVLFNRGDTWTGTSLTPTSGTSSHITIGAYGSGAKPVLKMCYDRSDASDWTDNGGNIWSTSVGTSGGEGLPNPSFDADVNNWTLYPPAHATLARTTVVYDSAPAGCEITRTDTGAIEFYTASLTIVSGTWYKLSFRAKVSTAFEGTNSVASRIALLKNTSPFTVYYSESSSDRDFSYGTDWKTYIIFFKANVSANDCRVDFRIDDLPNGATFYIDTCSFKQAADEEILTPDVGSLVFNNKGSFGWKRWTLATCTSQGDFFYDLDSASVFLYSTSNPATYYSKIECLLTKNIAVATQYQIFEDLDFQMGSGNGLSSGDGVNNIIVRRCDFSYIGGGDQYRDKSSFVRYGNGLQWSLNTHDNLVDRCSFIEIYDGGYSDESWEEVEKYNNVLINCLFVNNHHSITLTSSQSPTTTSVVHDCVIANNTCIDAGGEWSFAQRSNSARHIIVEGWIIDPNTTNVVVKNNICINSEKWMMRLPTVCAGILLDNNLYYDDTGTYNFRLYTTEYTTFATYKAAVSQEASSLNVAPLFRSSTDYHLTKSSPAIGAGIALSEVTEDYEGNPRHNPPSQGAYEWNKAIIRNATLKNSTI